LLMIIPTNGRIIRKTLNTQYALNNVQGRENQTSIGFTPLNLP